MSRDTINADMTFIRNEEVVATDMDGETVMMDVKQGAYFAISGSGTQIWQRLAEPKTIGELTAAMAEEFDTDNVEDLDQIVSEFVSGLLQKGLVKPVG